MILAGTEHNRRADLCVPVQFVVINLTLSTSATAQLSQHPNRTRILEAHISAREGVASAEQEKMELHCGNWVKNYSLLHKAIRSGESSPRYVMANPRYGLADSLVGIGSAFYLALLTDRAFVIDESNEEERFSTMYQTHFVDWMSNLQEIEGLSKYVLAGVQTDGPEPLEAFPFNVFRSGNLSTLGEADDVIYVAHCNAGIIVPLFDNPLYKQKLFDMGIRPETAFGCMFNFLFNLAPELRGLFTPQINIMQDNTIVKIGIQIRTGDDAMSHQRSDDPSDAEAEAIIAPHFAVFECAEEVEARVRRATNKEVIWFLLSDSILLRKSAITKYGNKVLTDVGSIDELKHLRKSSGGGGTAAMRYAAAEHWLFSLADYHVCNRGGFGKTAAIASMKWNFYYTVHLGCKAVNVHDLSAILPGI